MKLKQLDIKWRHLDKDGDTCRRCSDTGKTLAQTVIDLMQECALHGVQVVYRETKLSVEEIPQSNVLLINGVALESLLPMPRLLRVIALPAASPPANRRPAEPSNTRIRHMQVCPAALIREAA